ncbi:RNA polymerase sigma factor SigJ [Shinella granuli]|uniref:RNA polymerase sigma-70 factor (ECF subfamily) n=1 Tax=Shinella granuli TaxID=323621 RepID=A0A4R2CDL2_SHIGR|nr:RNA polymerase sigma factor SigJ [Shinella granuli]TCN37124.1 RNA polymerase sigma-70 factor (ECF subfamily) [Shinella granuli]
MDRHDTDLFEARRPFLTGLAYRILGSLAEAEDAVQDTWLKWQGAERRAVSNPAGWLTATCTRHCIDMLRSARRVRVDYVGAWLPEPIQTMTDETPESAMELSSSLSLAFLLVLERLAPKERAAYLLREIFDQPYEDIAAALGVQEAACRKLVSRARSRVGRAEPASLAPKQRQEELLAAFQTAITTGATAQLAMLMTEDIELRADGGGKVPTLLLPLSGKADVLGFLGDALHRYWQGYRWQPADINGTRGALVFDAAQIVASVSLACDAQGRLSGVYIMRNPDKLARLGDAERTIQ